MQASTAGLSHHYYKDKTTAMLPPKRVFYQHHLDHLNGLNQGLVSASHTGSVAGLVSHGSTLNHVNTASLSQSGNALSHSAGGSLNHSSSNLNHSGNGLNHSAGSLSHSAGSLNHSASNLNHSSGSLNHASNGLNHSGSSGSLNGNALNHSSGNLNHGCGNMGHNSGGVTSAPLSSIHSAINGHTSASLNSVYSRNTSGGQPQVHEVIRGPQQSHEVIRGQPSLIQEVRGQRVHEVRGQQQVHEVRSQQQVHEVSSPYKRPRTQSPVAAAAHPSGPGYPYSQQAAVPEGARYSQAPTPEGARYTMPVGSHPGGFDPSGLYVRPHLYQAGAPAPPHPSSSSAAEHVPDYRDQRFREMEMPPRRRPSMLNDYNSHAIALEREREREKFDREQAQRLLQSHHQSQQQQHHQQAAVAAAQQAAQQGQEIVTHSGYKKSRIMEVRPDLAQPLRIDTRVDSDKRMTVNLTDNLPTTYTPQVEAISPTLPSEDKADEVSNIKSSKAKDELLQNIKKVDREIAELEQQIGKLKKKQQQLEEQANKPPEERSNTPENENRNQSIAQIIYAENRKKAAEAHAQLDKLAPKIEMENGCLPLGFNIMSMFPIQPLYNQPSDTAVYHENKRRHMSFKKRLMLSFKKKHQSQRIREKYLTERYDQLLQQWVKKVERIENTTKRRAKDAKTREYFEKVFPELKKQRVDKESFLRNRGLGVVKSDAEMEQIIDGLHEAEEEEKKMRSYAVIPPMLLDARQRKLRFHNNNGLVEDPKTEHKENQNINVWTDQEKEVFRDKFLVHPKNFGFIAAHLERKSVQDCVQYYYLSKKKKVPTATLR